MFELTLFLFFTILNFLILRNINFFSKRINILDIPDKNRKLHSKPIFLGGGIILYFNYILILTINSYFKFSNNNLFSKKFKKFISSPNIRYFYFQLYMYYEQQYVIYSSPNTRTIQLFGLY